MCLRGKKFTALFLVFCIVALSGNLGAQVRKGVKISIEQNDDQIISGELISVKRDSLLLLDPETQADLSMPLSAVKSITVNNKSRILELGLLGVLGGASVQGLTGKSSKEVKSETQMRDKVATKRNPSFILGGVIAGGVGVLLGAVIGMNKTIQIHGRSDADIQKDLEKLSKQARVKGIQ